MTAIFGTPRHLTLLLEIIERLYEQHFTGVGRSPTPVFYVYFNGLNIVL